MSAKYTGGHSAYTEAEKKKADAIIRQIYDYCLKAFAARMREHETIAIGVEDPDGSHEFRIDRSGLIAWRYCGVSYYIDYTGTPIGTYAAMCLIANWHDIKKAVEDELGRREALRESLDSFAVCSIAEALDVI